MSRKVFEEEYILDTIYIFNKYLWNKFQKIMFLCVRSSDTGSNFCATNKRRGTVRSIHRRPLPSSLAYLFLAKIAHFPMLLLPLAVVVSVVVFSRCCCLAMLLLMLLLSRLIKERSLKSMPWSPHCHLARSGCLSQNDEY